MQMRIIRQLSAACVAAVALAASANANAQNNDYHATIHSANWVFGNADNGGAAIIRADILHQTCNTFVQDFATHEMWYMTDESNLYWVEVGVYDGEGTNSVANPCENDVIFWTDSRPNGGSLHNHFFSNGWSFGSYYQAVVTYRGGCTWDVQFGGLDLGTSTANCPGNGRFLYMGVETTNQGSGSVKGFATGWQAQDGSGNWSAMSQDVAGQGWGTMWMNWDNPPYIEQVGNSSWGLQTEEVLGEGF
jgi:hypothetical protein